VPLKESSREVASTTLAQRTFYSKHISIVGCQQCITTTTIAVPVVSSCDVQLWPMTLTLELDLNPCAKIISLLAEHTDTHSGPIAVLGPSKAVGNNCEV